MKVALVQNYIRIVEPGSATAIIKQWPNFKFNAKTSSFLASATIGNLEFMAKHMTLPPKLKAELEKLKEKEARINAERIAEDPKPIVNYPVNAKMYKHQIKAANMALIQDGGFGLLFEMGCGKTLTAIAIAGALYEQGKIKRILVIAPSSVCSVWPKDLVSFARFDFESEILLGGKTNRIKALKRLEGKPGLLVAVINYESTFRDGMFDALIGYNADLIICDESQRIKTHNAKQSKAIHKLGDFTRYKLILSGTPVQNSGIDLYSQYRFLDSRVFGTNFYSFKSKYCQMGGFGGKQIIGYQNTDELIKKEYGIAYRVTKDECLDLPEQIFEQRIVHFTPSERKLYESIKNKSYAELEDGGSITATTILTKLLRLQQLTGGFIPADDDGGKQTKGSTAKLDALADIFQDYVKETGDKLVVFARFTAEIKAIGELAQKMDIGHCTIDGSVPIKARGEIVKQFQEDTKTKVIICQLQCAGLGITLTAASTCVYYSLSFNLADYLQSTARIHRIGQTKKCLYIHLMVDDSIDSHTLMALEKKNDVMRTIVDSWRDYFK